MFLSENKESFGIKFDENLFLYVHRFNHVFSTIFLFEPVALDESLTESPSENADFLET